MGTSVSCQPSGGAVTPLGVVLVSPVCVSSFGDCESGASLGKVNWLVSCSDDDDKYTGPVILHWVVQRSAKTGAPITYKSFADYADAERHKADLEASVDPLDRHVVVAIESLPIGKFPNKACVSQGGFS
jgi:hypothetical protein